MLFTPWHVHVYFHGTGWVGPKIQRTRSPVTQGSSSLAMATLLFSSLLYMFQSSLFHSTFTNFLNESTWLTLWITGSKCVGKKVRHLTTTLPQLVASDISNFLTALESSLWTALSNLLLTLSDRLPSSRQNDESVPVSWLKRDSENMNSEYDIALGEK